MKQFWTPRLLIQGVTANMMMIEMPFLMNTTPMMAVPTI
jgi:hypothetical protein